MFCWRNAIDSQSATNKSSSEVYYYAPYLTQQGSPSAYRHHRTIPRLQPNSLSTTEDDTADQCLVPMLQNDNSHQFFEFDWDVAFSSHVHTRAQMAESINVFLQGELQDYEEENKELRVKTNMDHDMQWFLTCKSDSRLISLVEVHLTLS